MTARETVIRVHEREGCYYELQVYCENGWVPVVGGPSRVAREQEADLIWTAFRYAMYRALREIFPNIFDT